MLAQTREALAGRAREREAGGEHSNRRLSRNRKATRHRQARAVEAYTNRQTDKMAELDILDGVVAYVYGDAAGGVSTKLRQLGASIAARLSKDVSHVVFHRSLEPTPEARVAEDAELRALFEKGNKVCGSARGEDGARRVLRVATAAKQQPPLQIADTHTTPRAV